MAFANTVVMDLNVTIDGKYKKIGETTVHYPTLEDCGIQGQARAKDDKGVEIKRNGIFVYESPIADFIQQAIATVTLNKARNKFDKDSLKKGIIKLLPGQSVAVDWDELTEKSERTGEALALRRDARVDFETYLRSRDKADNVVTRLGDLFWMSNKVLTTASEKSVSALSTYVGDWVKQLPADKATRFTPKIEELQESINAASTASDDDLMA